MTDLEKEIAETEDKLRKLKAEQAREGEPMYALANYLHDVLCRMDGCSWDEERADFTTEKITNLDQRDDMHGRYLRLAQRLAQEIGLDEALRAVKVLLAGR